MSKTSSQIGTREHSHSRTRRVAAAATFVAAVAGAAAVAIGSLAGGASGAPSQPAPLSSTPKEVEMDPITGAVQSIEQVSPGAYQALLAGAHAAAR